MNPVSGKNLRNLAAIAVVMTTAFVCRVIAFKTDDYFVGALLMMVRNVMHISMVVVWTVSIYMRVVSKQIRNMLMSVGVLMILWLVIRTCKLEFLYTTDTLTRYFWYAFYIPMILIPLIGVFITMHIGKGDDFTIPVKYRLFYIPAMLVILLVFTNDYHRLVFDFPNGIQNFNSDYTYGILYLIPAGWFTLLGFYFVLKLLIKNRVPGSRTFQKVHIVIMGCAVVFWCLYAFTGIDADLTAVDCALITLLLESAIQSGLIRTNTNFAKLFEIASVTAQIADKDFNICIRSARSSEFTRDVLINAVQTPQNLGDFVLNSAEISGGYVFWQDDIRYISDLIETLQETQKQLSENNFLLQAEYELKERKAKTEEKSRLFNQLIDEISPQLAKAKQLLAQLQASDESRTELLAKLSVIGAYIKRRGNLFIISEDKEKVNARELEFCIGESLSSLRLLQVHTSFVFNLQGELPTAALVHLYDIFELFIEEMLGSVNAVLVKISDQSNAVSMRLLLGHQNGNIAFNTNHKTLAGCVVMIDDSEDDTVIDVLLPKEVAQ